MLKFLQRLLGGSGGSGGLRPTLQRIKHLAQQPKAIWNKKDPDNGPSTATAEADPAPKSKNKNRKKAKTKSGRKSKSSQAREDSHATQTDLAAEADQDYYQQLKDAEESGDLPSSEDSGHFVATPVTKEPVHPFNISESVKKPNIKTCTFEPLSFDILSSWMVEYVPDLEGTLIFCTDYKAEWQANMFVQYREDTLERGLKKMLDLIEQELAQQKENFSLNRKEVRPHPNNFTYGLIESTCNKDGILLIEWEILIPCYANTMLRISTSSAYEDWKQNRIYFKGMLDSVRPGG
ncbi:MAG: hypothetical protein R3236_07570 [Phycisphaeraceae bacterium]|nr:hypothetical protein [Phycisphaeraceae bacterium]